MRYNILWDWETGELLGHEYIDRDTSLTTRGGFKGRTVN